ncbi:hypothetical protein [Roseovarius sp. C03]|uniref:hypothetical protein n=1 Tax=Roseovarius sp. C03 TaxID=3449222 RepID=UPI003EDBF609
MAIRNWDGATTFAPARPEKFPKFFAPRQTMAANPGKYKAIRTTRPKRRRGRKELRGKTMKKRWMKSLIETSRQATPDMPFSRRVRYANRLTPKASALRIA